MTDKLLKLINYTKIYLAFMFVIYTCLYVGIFAGGILSMTSPSKGKTPTTLPEVILIMTCVSVFIIPFIILHIYTLINIAKPKKLVYYLIMVCLVFGFNAIMTIVPTVILFVKWFETDIKEYYLGKKSQPEQLNS